MIYSASDLDVFVMTFNRSELLEHTIRSFVNQTVQGYRFRVLDNASTDNTGKVVQSYSDANVELVQSTENVGSHGNFARAQALARGSWTLVFHDDDLVHPMYLERVLEVLNRYEDAVLVGSAMLAEESPSNQDWPHLSDAVDRYRTASAFAAALYAGLPFHLGSAVYRTDILKTTFDRPLVYGKVSDRPLLLDVARRGDVIVFRDPHVKYRIHGTQDSRDLRTGPFPNELLALHRCYRELLGSNPFTKSGRVFLGNNFAHLWRESAKLRGSFRVSRGSYLRKACGLGASSAAVLMLGFLLLSTRTVIRRVIAVVRQ